MERRGYVWDSPHASIGVVTTLSPDQVDKEWVPGSPLFARDLRRAKVLHASRRLHRPTRHVEILSSPRDAQRVARDLQRARRPLAADIETDASGGIACLGFADQSDRAFVFTQAVLGKCRELLGDKNVTTIWHNAFFDCYVLRKAGFEIGGKVEDTMLKWHSMHPELAGAREDAKRRRTSKALKFLASIYTLDAWWKDYEYQFEEDRYILNGRDCAITFDIWEQMEPEVEALGVREVYERACGLIMPFTTAHLRGMQVDEGLRQRRIAAIEERLGGFNARLNGIVEPLLEERLNGERRLFEQIEGVCPCCRHASKKQQACWGCAGFEKAPSKAELVARGGDPKAKKDALEAEMLSVCKVCEGTARKESLAYNPNSPEQTKVVLYDLLKLPKRYSNGKPTTDEQALKSLRALV
jgi:hypothetical protein